ncbi:hypothetical protein EU545_02295 [Candidatus Thorarchaeota archaeon]|nr:MAG: hypothetical protein EU545_02295 [Candidatus Thorarchaeota archaeon]
MLIDLNVKADTSELWDEMVRTAHVLGFDAIAVSDKNAMGLEEEISDVDILPRTDLTSRSLRGMKNQAGQWRKRALVISAPLRGVLTANWAAEDSRVDLLTLQAERATSRLRRTTAKLAAENGTALEICINPLLHSQGLSRSKTIKFYREAASVAVDAGMPIVLSSGASHPLSLRSPKALQFIGTVLGLRFEDAGKAVLETPSQIVTRNRQKLSDDYIAPGLKIVKGGEKR